jgi:hypothetical protein
MKFLTFNIVVAAALAYLVLGDKAEIRDTDVVSKLTASAEAAWIKAQDAVDATTKVVSAPASEPVQKVQVAPVPMPEAEPVAKAAPVVRRAPAPKGQEVEVANVPEVPAKSAVQIDEEKAAKVARSDPAAARRRAEVLGEQTIETSEPEVETAGAKFMTPRERRRELLRLAEDMELRFLDTVKQ